MLLFENLVKLGEGHCHRGWRANHDQRLESVRGDSDHSHQCWVSVNAQPENIPVRHRQKANKGENAPAQIFQASFPRPGLPVGIISLCLCLFLAQLNLFQIYRCLVVCDYEKPYGAEKTDFFESENNAEKSRFNLNGVHCVNPDRAKYTFQKAEHGDKNWDRPDHSFTLAALLDQHKNHKSED